MIAPIVMEDPSFQAEVRRQVQESLNAQRTYSEVEIVKVSATKEISNCVATVMAEQFPKAEGKLWYNQNCTAWKSLQNYAAVKILLANQLLQCSPWKEIVTKKTGKVDTKVAKKLLDEDAALRADVFESLKPAYEVIRIRLQNSARQTSRRAKTKNEED